MTVGDFLRGTSGSEPARVLPTYRDGAVKTADLDKIFPSFITEELRRGLYSFDKKLRGFACDDAILTGAETRTSAPVRIMRNEELRAIGKGRVYPCGEGAGYAGGITSAAIDGIHTAMAVINRFKP
jgi:uncharacterized FAD-dependent dehydrogenase